MKLYERRRMGARFCDYGNRCPRNGLYTRALPPAASVLSGETTLGFLGSVPRVRKQAAVNG